ncbi:MAG: phasin family protein [Alphaproteobacteria bacterium]|nr:phasin family protein [Alphaproteobacteria bacterium]
MADGAREQTAKAQTSRVIGQEREMTEKVMDSQRRIADTLTEQSGRTLESVAQASEIYRDATGAHTEDMSALLSSYSVVAKGMQDMQRAWLDSMQKSVQTGAKAPQDMMRATTLSELARIHRDLLRQGMEVLLEGNARMLRLCGKIAEDAARPIEDRARRLS